MGDKKCVILGKNGFYIEFKNKVLLKKTLFC